MAGFYIRTLVNLLNVAGEMNKYVPREKTECMSSTILLVKGNKNVLGSYCKLEKRELERTKCREFAKTMLSVPGLTRGRNNE